MQHLFIAIMRPYRQHAGNVCTQNGANRRNGESKTQVSHRRHAECSHGYERSSYCKIIKYVAETLGKHFRCYILFGNTLHIGLVVFV